MVGAMRMNRAVVAVLAVVFAACSGGGSHRAPAGSSAPPRDPAGAVTTTPTDWPFYHGNVGHFGVSSTMPAFTGHLAVTKRLALDGAVYGSPIVIGGHVVVATENDTVYAYTLAGALVWKRHLGTASPASERPCGNIDPLGITGTPAYYHGVVYVAPEFSGNPPTHQLYALNVTTGAVAWHRSIDFAGADQRVMQERGALNIAGGRVWVPFGGLAGDCGNYKGRLVGVPVGGVGAAAVYTVPTTREAGIWAPPGPTVDSAGYLYAAVGNGAAGVGDAYDHSDSVLKLDSNAHLLGYFAPTSWASENDSDLDLGSQAPARTGGWVFIAGKSGTAYVLRSSALGGIGGQVSKRSVCRSFGGTAVVGSTVYVPCTDGVRAVAISSTGAMTIRWHAAVGGSPVVGAGRVWTLDANAGVLHALSTATGASTAHIGVGVTSRFATPALYGHYVLVPTLAGLTIVSES
jgi:outer membrane protein assembly factor BamB